MFEHRPGRTVLDTDNVWFTLLTMNVQQVHFDAAYAAKTEWKKLLVDSTFTLALLTGMSVRTVSAKVVANLGWDEVRFPKPVFHGDTLRIESEVLELRESKSRPQNGIVIFAHGSGSSRLSPRNRAVAATLGAVAACGPNVSSSSPGMTGTAPAAPAPASGSAPGTAGTAAGVCLRDQHGYDARSHDRDSAPPRNSLHDRPSF